MSTLWKLTQMCCDIAGNTTPTMNGQHMNEEVVREMRRQTFRDCRAELAKLINETNCHPIMVRLAWHDAGTYDCKTAVGGANGSIRFEPEINHGANAGLKKGLELLQLIKDKFLDVSWADLIQMASATAIELAGGPRIPMKYGRLDVFGGADCPPEGNLPAGGAPWPAGADGPQKHIRDIFYRMGFGDKEIVALSGAHTLGRARTDRSGFGAGDEGSKYTAGDVKPRGDGQEGYGNPGGKSWTPNWLKFDNSYFTVLKDKMNGDLLALDTDKCLFEDAAFKPFAEKYAADESAFFKDYAMAHKALSELGSKWEPADGMYIDPPTVERLQECQEVLKKMVDEVNCHPILIRLAWHDSGTYDAKMPMTDWPNCGGANGSIRFEPEINHGANAGLQNALNLLKPIKASFPEISWADLMQMASATAIEVAGGPKIPMRYGRLDAWAPKNCPKEGNLPAGGAPWPGSASTPQQHLRDVFHRMGLSDKDIVALSGAHTLGRAYKFRSGFGLDEKGCKYTTGKCLVRKDGKEGHGQTDGGQSWTPKWLSFDNSYFTYCKQKGGEDLLSLDTDQCLFEDAAFKPFAEKYATDESAFFKDYAQSHHLLSELGSKFYPAEGIAIDPPTPERLRQCKEALSKLIDEKNCHPIMVRLGWHDAGTFTKAIGIEHWPRCGGANGSIRFEPEIAHGCNAGLAKALELLQPIKKEFFDVSWADLMQMASATAIELAGGPKIPMKYGRIDAVSGRDCTPEGTLPAGGAPWPGKAKSAPEHLRDIFYRMGLGDKEIVALSGAHTIGRARTDRSGFGAGDECTKFTKGGAKPRGDGKPGMGHAGGQSWTEKWLAFDNSYFKVVKDKVDGDLLALDTDKCLFEDAAFKPFAEKYAASQDDFFKDYAMAHKALSELGSKFIPAEGISIA
ncbi:unnamed protein product [Vitrella brassicaformis CCMP3155]|uniref:Plant heme peroxidase family profile domain-containing protein n=2 Tax=Vitrella brassicaformis TaxID=1169539 RepID=A0A0G4FGS3_VITBC|nr:unnamed protein product [Vitrella brassicaformis CCMP3155]|eukprot:CEM12648.1 unnamed protein product [Vitrella brassicaformis CCMP3155]